MPDGNDICGARGEEFEDAVLV